MRLATAPLVPALVAGIGLSTVTTATPAVADTATAASTVVSSAPAPGGAAGRTSVVSLPFGGVDRSYRLFVPTALPAGPRPLVLLMHGLGTTAIDMEARGTDLGAVGAGAVVAYPNGLGSSWNVGICCGDAMTAGSDDVGFLAAVIADVSSRVAVDASRIAVGGHSNGGFMAYRFACARPDLTTVIFIVASVNLSQCSPSRPVSLLQVHGSADLTVPYNGLAMSPIVGIPLPAVAPTVFDWAAADGCSRTFTTSSYMGRADVNDYVLDACPAGTTVEVVRSKYMTHVWPVVAADTTKTGVAPTAMLWTYVARAWSGRVATPLTSTTLSTTPAPGGAAGSTSVVALPVAGVLRRYRLFTPTAPSSAPRSLVVLMHDAGSTAAALESTGVDVGAGTAGALVAYPESAAGTWADTDTAMVQAVVADVSARTGVDGARVVVGGQGTGGTLAYRFACARPDLVRGVYAVAAAGPSPACAPTRPVSLLAVHGSADTTASYSGVAATVFGWAAAVGCGATFSASTYGSRTDVTDYRFTTCPSGTSVEVVRSKTMGHVWPTTAGEIAATGVAPSTLLWTWAASL